MKSLGERVSVLTIQAFNKGPPADRKGGRKHCSFPKMQMVTDGVSTDLIWRGGRGLGQLWPRE